MGNAGLPFVTKQFDEFEDKAITAHVREFIYRAGGVPQKGDQSFGDGISRLLIYKKLNLQKYNADFRWRRVKNKDIDSLVLDCTAYMYDDWIHLRDGKIIFNCDQENLSFGFHETETDVKHVSDCMYCFEKGFYLIPDPSALKALCDASILKMRLKGDVSHIDIDANACRDFQKYCKEFYNNSYDPSAYRDELFEPPVSTVKLSGTQSSRQSPPKHDARDAKAKIPSTKPSRLMWIGVGVPLLIGAIVWHASSQGPTPNSGANSSQATPAAEHGPIDPRVESPSSSNGQPDDSVQDFEHVLQQLRPSPLGQILDASSAHRWSDADALINALHGTVRPLSAIDLVAKKKAVTEGDAALRRDDIPVAAQSYEVAAIADPADINVRMMAVALLAAVKRNGDATRLASEYVARNLSDGLAWEQLAEATAPDHAVSMAALQITALLAPNPDHFKKYLQGIATDPVATDDFKWVASQVLNELTDIPSGKSAATSSR